MCSHSIHLNHFVVQKYDVNLRELAMFLGTVNFHLVRYPVGKRGQGVDRLRGHVNGTRIRNYVYYSTAIASGEFEAGTAPKYYQAAVNAAWPFGKLPNDAEISMAMVEAAYLASKEPDMREIQNIMDILDGNEPTFTFGPDTPT